ncbi:MAG: hypothetical protein KBB11_01435 [Bacteroidales bacterium]|nr:hypothetical protein [Bacteroidales bacterium]HOY37971.1 hypothetical protein [Bacteroidales bacterium]HQP03172.1 hypothetical protein [Bacteroidales bacterium]
MIRLKIIGLLLLFGLLSSCGIRVKYDEADKKCRNAPDVVLKKFDGGVFSIEIPESWKVITAGNCETFSFCAYDSIKPANRVFLLGEIGPVYQHIEKKREDFQSIQDMGLDIGYFDMPVVLPFTPECYFENLYLMFETEWAKAMKPICPDFHNTIIINSETITPVMSDGISKVLRAIHSSNDTIYQTLILLNLAPFYEEMGKTKKGLGKAYIVLGVNAEFNDFEALLPLMLQIAASFHMNENYIQNCSVGASAFAMEQMKLSKSLTPYVTIMRDDWNARDKSMKYIILKSCDSLLNKIRIFDPNTGTPYLVSASFFDKYINSKEEFEMNKLKILSVSDTALWLKTPLDSSYIR